MTVAVSKAAEDGAEAVICASTGNTAASAAAYAARAGIPAVVLTPAGAVAGPKVAQTRMFGAKVLEVRGDFDEALAAAQELGRRGTHVLVELRQPVPQGGSEDRRLRDRRGARHRSRRVRDPVRRRRQHLGLRRRHRRARALDADLLGRGGAPADDARLRDPDRRSRPRRERARIRRNRGDGLRRGDRRRLAAARNASKGSSASRRRQPASLRSAAAPSQASGSSSRSRATGSRTPRAPTAMPRRCSRSRQIPTRSPPRHADDRVPSPATSANIGAGFDTAAVAFDLWNELEVTDGDGCDRRGRGRGRAPRRRVQPRRARLRAARRPGRKALPLHEQDPARARPRLVGGRDRARPRGGGTARERRGAARRRDHARSRTPTTSPRRSSAASRSPGTGGSPGSPSGCRSLPSPSSRRSAPRPRAPARRCPRRSPHAEAAASAGRAALLGAGAASGDAALFAAALERLAPRAVPPLRDARRRSAPTPPAGCARRDAVGVGADRDRLGHGRALRCAAELRAASPTTRSSSSTSPRGARCERRARRRAAARRTTRPGTFPVPSTSTRRPTSRRSAPIRRTAVAIRCPTTRSWRGSSGAPGSGRRTFVLALDDGSGWAARCWWLLRHVGHDAAGTLDMRGYVGPLSTEARRAGPDRVPGAAARGRHDHGRGDPRPPRRSVARCSSTPAAASAGSATRSRSTRSPGASPAPPTPPSPSRSLPGATDAAELVSYCGSGVTACVVAQRLVLAGRDDVRLYPGSFSEWCRREGYPIEKGTP